MSSAAENATYVLNLADWFRYYVFVVSSAVIGVTVAVAMLTRPPSRVLWWWVVGLDLVLGAVLFGQVANLGLPLTWRTVALGVGVSVLLLASSTQLRIVRRRVDRANAIHDRETAERAEEVDVDGDPTG